VPSKKKSAVDNILGVSDGSANFEERMQRRTSSKTEVSDEDSEWTGGLENTQGQQKSEQPPSEQSESGATQNENSHRKRAANRRARTNGTALSGLKLDTQTEQTTKASYYLSPMQAKRLDDLRTVFRYNGGYTPRDASYSRIVGLAIDRLHEEVFHPGSGD
jgi:hypothetical protein